MGMDEVWEEYEELKDSVPGLIIKFQNWKQ